MEKKKGLESEALKELMDDCLLDTKVSPFDTANGETHLGYNFEIQLPTLSEFCIDWTYNDPNEIPADFKEEEWVFDEVKIWVEDGGGETMVDDEPKGKEIQRQELEKRLAVHGLNLADMARHYYARGVEGNKSPKRAHVSRPWHSPFPRRK